MGQTSNSSLAWKKRTKGRGRKGQKDVEEKNVFKINDDDD